MRRLVFLLLLCLALVPPASASPAPAKESWALPEIRIVTAQGLMGGGDPAAFHADDPLTQGALARLVADLTQQEPATPANPAVPVTMAGLDAALVRALNLSDAAAAFAAATRTAGLAPPARFGTEVVARLLGLRTNHPAAQDALELRPNDPATRAYTPMQRNILHTAVSLIGFPYVWGGTSEGPQAPFGVQATGGFDCSGFVWNVYKLHTYPGAPNLAGVLRGRTTMEMSGEVPKKLRIPLEKLAPGDVLFFGPHGAKSKPAEVDHSGIYLGNGWLIHSSEYGVALAPLDGWYAEGFAWARRPLSE
jgi:cell wall-associated NlpC family hydrolase